MRKAVLVFVAALLLAFLGTSSASAQTQFGSVRGVVRDPQGAAVPDAKVVLSNMATNLSQETATNGEGLYVVANVAPGSYEIKISKEGFRTSRQRLTVGVAETVALSFALELGNVSETVTVTESAVTINTTSGEIARTISSRELDTLPLITRNPYALISLAPGAAETGRVTGDMRGGNGNAGEGLGLAVGGARTSSINFMLDGSENNDTFVAGVGQVVPLDAVQEFKVQSNSTTAEFGRNSINTNVITKSGTNSFHGSAYEFYRGAALSTATFDDKANDQPKSGFVRNQFGASAGGPVIKDKVFSFGSFEGVRIRSTTLQQFFIPTQDFLNVSSADTSAFVTGFGGLPSSNCADQTITAQDIVETIEGGGAGSYASSPLLDANTGAAIPAATQLFCRTSLRRPFDSGAGNPQNTWLATGRVDYVHSSKTNFFARYAYQKNELSPGTVSFSPFEGFTTGLTAKNQNVGATLTHSFSSNLFAELRGTYNRVNSLLPLGSAPATTACWQYDLFNQTQAFGGQLIVFPGYVPDVCAFAGIPFGGPQNIYQGHGGMTWLRGRHTLKWGGSYFHMRDNRTFGAYENAYFDTFSMQGMIDGAVDFIFAAVDPKGHVPGETYCITAPCPAGSSLDGPLGFPSFTRHYHYNELAGYVEDSVKLTRRFTLTAGLRYEYYGVHHSPANEKLLDANLYLDAVGSVPPLTAQKSIFEQVRDARFRRTNQFYRADYNNFAPRIGIAYDVFGNGRTVFRAGYGIYYDRNFGNAVFNAIQNPPNYAVLSFTPTGVTIQPNQFDTVGQLGGSFVVSSSARMLNNDLVTAYSQQWNATVDQNLFGKGIITSVSYLGYKGDKLYSLNNLNQRGACLLLVQAVPGSPCNPAGGNSSRINQTGLTGMNRRGNEGLSRYHALALEVRTQQIASTGLNLNGTYTWAHSIDNESSFFGDSNFEGFSGFGFRDAYNPAADRASSSNDIRHRGTISGTWEIPAMRNQPGMLGRVLGGWSLSGIFVAQTGGAFPVYDGSTSGQCVNSGTNFCYPVLTGTGSIPAMTDIDTGNPNSFNLYDLGASGVFTTQAAFCAANSLSTPIGTFGGGASVGQPPFNYTASQDITACTAALINLRADLVSARNLFRTPGIWNIDGAVLKDFRMPWEGHKIQFRAEFYNLVNHSNLYAFPGTNVFSGSASFVEGKRGVTPSNTRERRNIQLALRYIF